MRIKSKLIGLNVLGQLMFGLIFFTALYFSYNAITEELQSVSLLERYSEDALDLYIILHLSESGDAEGTRESLNLKLDTYIYEISQLLSQTDSTTQINRAHDLLKKISRHRATFPRQAKNVFQQDVDAILARYVEQGTI